MYMCRMKFQSRRSAMSVAPRPRLTTRAAPTNRGRLPLFGHDRVAPRSRHALKVAAVLSRSCSSTERASARRSLFSTQPTRSRARPPFSIQARNFLVPQGCMLGIESGKPVDVVQLGIYFTRFRILEFVQQWAHLFHDLEWAAPRVERLRRAQWRVERQYLVPDLELDVFSFAVVVRFHPSLQLLVDSRQVVV